VLAFSAFLEFEVEKDRQRQGKKAGYLTVAEPGIVIKYGKAAQCHIHKSGLDFCVSELFEESVKDQER
jgi:hypothetical protein